MMTMVSIVGVVVGAAALERRFAEQGNAAAARATKSFGRMFLIGAGGWLAYQLISGMLALLVI